MRSPGGDSRLGDVSRTQNVGSLGEVGVARGHIDVADRTEMDHDVDTIAGPP